MLKIIDVSYWQGNIDWEKVKPQIDGAILRCGYGSDKEEYDDEQFKRNADECTRLGIPFGVYLYSYAKTEDKARSEAAHVLRLVKGYKLSFPIYYDLEEKGTEKGAINRANIFGDIIEKAGYWCGIYANLNWWNNYLVGLDRFTKWVAQYNDKCDYKGSNLDIWQYSSSGKIDGINGNVDMNYCYRDFPAEINGSKPAQKTVAEIAKEVIAGKWGNGADRKRKLQAAGYDYNAVQAAVNALLTGKQPAPAPVQKPAQKPAATTKSIDAVAREVIAGKWGNGSTRKKKLQAAGYDYNAVQKRVNELL